MLIRETLHQMKLKNLLLFYSANICILLSLLSILGIFFDTRLILGINPWIKVLKFDVSVGIYLFTLIWILKDLHPRFIREISFKTVICLFVEIFLITIQAIRGVTSHFNQSTALDGMIFSVMGIFIAYNTYLIGKVLYKLIKTPPHISLIHLRALQYGLITLLYGSFIGGYMSSQTGHSVGMKDGGPGLFFVNWNTLAGDLRVPHFIGLHGIQVFIILGFLISCLNIGKSIGSKILLGCFILFITANTLVLIEALNGLPFIH
jgi:hypothetical protein